MFISQVLLGPGQQHTFQDVLTVHIKVDFDEFINKNKRCFASWTNPKQPVTERGCFRLLIMVDDLRLFFDWIRLLFSLWPTSTVKIEKIFLPPITNINFIGANPFLRFCVLFASVVSGTVLFCNVGIQGNISQFMEPSACWCSSRFRHRNDGNASNPLCGHFAFSEKVKVCCFFLSSVWSVPIMAELLKPSHNFRRSITWDYQYPQNSHCFMFSACNARN